MITNTSDLYSVKEEEPSEDIHGPSEELHSSVQGEERDEIIIGGGLKKKYRHNHNHVMKMIQMME